MISALGRRQLFVYWRLRGSDLESAVAAVLAEQEALRQRHIGLLAKLLVRGDESGPEATLMETYAIEASMSTSGLDEDDMDALDSAVAEVTRPWLLGRRHREVFDAVET